MGGYKPTTLEIQFQLQPQAIEHILTLTKYDGLVMLELGVKGLYDKKKISGNSFDSVHLTSCYSFFILQFTD